MAHTEDTFHQLRSLCAYQTAETEDLASSQGKGAILERTVMDTGISSDIQKHLSCLRIILWRINVGQLTTNHLFDDLIIRNLVHMPGTDIGTVSHDGNIITNLTDLRHLMGNIDEGYTS